jgi:exportin-7
LLQLTLLCVAASFESIGAMLATADTAMFPAEEAKKVLIGLARDLRGLAFAFNTKTSYMMLFDWVYPCLCAGGHRVMFASLENNI